MIRPQDIRRSTKTVIEWGQWSSERMTRTAFPLSKPKDRAFRLGSAFRWRVVRFEALGETFRLLIAYNALKEQYRATLGLEAGQDIAVLASYEFHGTHAGWHLQAACGDIAATPRGMMRGHWQRRVPSGFGRHRQTLFGVSTDGAALERAAAFFLLHKAPGTLI